MSLEDRIKQDYIQAMKDKDGRKVTTLSFLRAQIKNASIEKKTEALSDVEIIAIIKKQVKQRLDAIAQFEKGGREDLVEKEKMEVEILKTYLPEEMPLQELEAIINEIIQQTGAMSMKDMGKVMKEVLPKVAGRADSKTVSDIVRKKLS